MSHLHIRVYLGILIVVATQVKECSSTVRCPSGFTSSGFVCYMTDTSCRTWNEAQNNCRSYGGTARLLAVKDDETFNVAQDAMKAIATRKGGKLCEGGAWLGAIHYRWEDGTNDDASGPAKYFADKQPDRLPDESCIEIRHVFNDMLNDHNCNLQKESICQACHLIDNCGTVKCPTAANTVCEKCNNNSVLYKLSSDKRQCNRMCTFDHHECWPGTCSDNLTSKCTCASGFHKVDTELETSCQLNENNAPSIVVCLTTIESNRGEKKASTSSNKSNECRFMQDFYGNVQAALLIFQMTTEFRVNISSFPHSPLVQTSKFGVTDTTVYIKKVNVSGSIDLISTHKQFVDTNHSMGALSQTFSEGNITLMGQGYVLTNGERMCIEYSASGGGFVNTWDNGTASNRIVGPWPYLKTNASKTVCYRYDNAKPLHCLVEPPCTKNVSEPIQVENRITRTGAFLVTFYGWKDPIPVGGNASHASGIESFEISVHETLNGSVDTSKSVFSKKVNSSINSVELTLKSDTPKLYCILLDAKDHADNVMQSRRFVLYDNSSQLKIDNSTRLLISSASSQTGFMWQTHHNEICLEWKNYFYNDFYIKNDLLAQIRSSGDITGIYEQTNGVLPISGTRHINGIVSFKFSWSLNYGNISKKIDVQDFIKQLYCHNLNVTDGETYTLYVEATDIVENTCTEHKHLYIDRTAPQIENIWLVKDGYERLFVHGSKDLSEMKLTFEARDQHSGIKIIEWSLGTTDSGKELGQEFVSVGTIPNKTCPDPAVGKCYCPHVGLCEMYTYNISLNKLQTTRMNVGNHNRIYYFTIKVTNNAMLTNTEHMDILVDESPPEPGVVYEGPEDAADIDYTNDISFIAHWSGFLDHESAIKLYRIGLADRCLETKEVYDFVTSGNVTVSQYAQVLYTEKSVTLQANFTGKMFVTIIAINNAMEASKAVCSDGITKDDTAPEIQNITLQNGRWSESIVCRDGRAWLLQSSLTKSILNKSRMCSKRCVSDTADVDIFNGLSTSQFSYNDTEISEFMCSTLKAYTYDTIIYLPNDHLYLTWTARETGSQIENYFVGFGVSRDKGSVSYEPTHGKTFYKSNHVGINSGDLFYIFLKSVNKAGLESVAMIGPVLIDSTPPVYNHLPTVTVDEDFIIIGWQNDTFTDLEQKTGINQIFVQLGNGDHSVTPLLQWQMTAERHCANYTGGCLKYPLRALQKHDTANGLAFVASVLVYNNAGHFIQVNTATFRLPSRYQPGDANVFDVDPESNDTSSFTDVDVHYSLHKLCSRWQGFRHHEHIHLEVGIGTNIRSDNVVSFKPINQTDFFCIDSDNVVSNQKYYFLIRASCSGGQTVASSNGVIILNETQIINSLDIIFGQKYEISANSGKLLENLTMFSFCIEESLEIGVKYSVEINEHLTKAFVVDQSTASVKLNSSKHLSTTTIFIIIPFIEHPCFIVHSNNETDSGFKVIVYKTATEIINLKEYSLTVYLNSIYHLPPSIIFEVSLVENACTQPKNSTCIKEIISDPNRTDNNFQYNINEKHLRQRNEFTIEIKVCTVAKCSRNSAVYHFDIESSEPSGTIEKANILISENKNCIDINIVWSEFMSKSRISLYKWAVSRSNYTSHIISQWNIVLNNASNLYSVNECVNLPVYPYSELYACVVAYSAAGNKKTMCRRFYVNSVGEYKNNVVYDFDASAPSWKNNIQLIHSSNLGYQYKTLHDAELDFGTQQTLAAGAVLYSANRNVTWYLSKTNQITSKMCSKDCVYSITNNLGYVIFENRFLMENTLYFICAFSPQTYIEREFSSENLEEVQACSNGFFIDKTRPTPGYVNVSTEYAGFLSHLTGITITWRGFSDNIDATLLGYPDRIKYYEYAIGSRPNGEDVQNFTNVGLSEKAFVLSVNSADGHVLYVTVKAIDHAGLSTSVVSQEFIVDTSAPDVGTIAIRNLQGGTYLNSESLSIALRYFYDKESGIDHFEIGLGSRAYSDDVIALKSYHSNDIDFHLEDKLQDGHKYFSVAKAQNKAGLLSRSVIQEFIFDKSPPTGGYVMDGNWANQTDIDYQTDITTIMAHWNGFIDQHSGVLLYRVGLGTSPFKDDIESMVDIGLSTVVSWRSLFTVGQKYFVTVDACNGAELCRTSTSNGLILDNSPPTPGLVSIGSDGIHQKYHPHRSSVHIRWAGFEDAHSGIDHFETCIGTLPEHCNIEQFSNAFLQSNVIRTGLHMPLNTNIYATVNAKNKAGLSVTQWSDAFQIDDTPPDIISKPTFDVDYNHAGVNSTKIQWEKSILRVRWKFEDKESPVVSHMITLKTHHDGHTPMEHMHVGNVDYLTINLDKDNWLHNGDRYKIIVTSCNVARLCTSAESDDILIDSTPPHVGGFKPPMIWWNYNNSKKHMVSKINVTWYGFVDPESNIDIFYLTVSKKYSGSELSGEVVTRRADMTTNEHSTEIELRELISADDLLFLTIWAKNNAGLNSSIVKVSVIVLEASSSRNASQAHGNLEIEKHSCISQYCTNDCTCAAFQKRCTEKSSNSSSLYSSCSPLNGSYVAAMNLPHVDVFGGLGNGHHSITASSACLSGHWVTTQSSNKSIQRFQWSMGIADQEVGVGIFDSILENIWHDVEMATAVVYCLPFKKSIHHDEYYAIYVRAWYASDEYAEFKSLPIKVDQTPPNNAKGKRIKDSDSSCLTDYDIIDWMDTMTACWNDAFMELQSEITFFMVSLGTTINGSDVYPTSDVGLALNITLRNLSLAHGTKYYFTVTAYNSVGLHTTLNSDGFMVDMDDPIAGVVFNSKHHSNVMFQSATKEFSLSWHGFIDHYAGIRKYSAAVTTPDLLDNLTFINVGVHTSFTFSDLNLQHNTSYIGVVKAYDAAGHTSRISLSLAKLIDMTPPTGFACMGFVQLFETKTYQQKSETLLELKKGKFYQIKGVITTDNAGIDLTHTIVVVMNKHHVKIQAVVNHDGSQEFEHSFISPISGQSNITLEFRKSSNLNNYTVTTNFAECTQLIASNGTSITVQQIGPSTLSVKCMIIDEESSLYKVELGVGTTPAGFQVRPPSTISGVHSNIIQTDVQHGTPIYVTVSAENHAGMRSSFSALPIILDKTPPSIVFVKSEVVEKYGTSSIRTQWKVHDFESGIKSCYCGLGKRHGADDIVGLRLMDNFDFCEFHNFTLNHGSVVYVLIRCVNKVEMAIDSSTTSITISRTPPRANNAHVAIVSSCKQTTNSSSAVQTFKKSDYVCIRSGTSNIRMEWYGFEDESKIVRYEYRIRHENETIVNWTNAEKRTFVEFDVAFMPEFYYVSEVRAINTGQHVSDMMSSSFVIQESRPTLTGKNLTVTENASMLLVDWKAVFSVANQLPVTYSLVVGSRPRFSDVLELNNILDTSYEVRIPESTIVSPKITELFISITCEDAFSMFVPYNTDYKL